MVRLAAAETSGQVEDMMSSEPLGERVWREGFRRLLRLQKLGQQLQQSQAFAWFPRLFPPVRLTWRP